MVERELGGTHGAVRLRYSPETVPLGTGGALGLAAANLASDPVLVLNGDSYCHADFPAFLDFHQQHPDRPAIFLTRVSDVSRYGQVVLGDEARVTRFAEKSAPTTPPTPGYINAGIYLLPQALIAGIPRGRAVSIEREIFPAAIPAGLYAFRSESPFIDIGTPESYRAAEEFFSTAHFPRVD